MIADHFQHRVSLTALQGIRAKADHAMLREDSIDFGFIHHEVWPGSIIQPGRIPTKTKSLITGVHRPLFLVHPLSEYTVRIEVSAAQVPVTVIPNLHLSRMEIPLHIRRCLSQSDLGFSCAQGIRRHPKTEFVLL